MDQLQRKELYLLKTFIDICDKLGLRYYLVCGTALGAVKYGGFIPWDDDVDVALVREDYSIFCEKAQELLPEGIFLQTYHTDPKYPCIFAKLRDSTTTYIEKSCQNISMNHGVYIDVFPLDGYPRDVKLQRKVERKKHLYKLLISSVYDSDCSFKIKLLRKCFIILGFHKRTNNILSKYEKLISAYPTHDSILLCNHGNWQGKLEYTSKEQYGEGTVVTFESVPVRVPSQYDAYLTQKYGDWKSDPPIEEQIGHHYYTVMDLDKPYTEYIQ